MNHEDINGEPRGVPRATIFANPLLERLTFVHPALTAAIFLPVIAVLLRAARVVHGLSLLVVAACVLAGAVLWSLAEYLMHRYAFHYVATSRVGKTIVFLIHGVHHDFPHDPRVAVSPAISVPIAIVSYAAIVGALGRPLGFPTLAGFYLGFLAYDVLHCAVHMPGPPAAWLRALRAHHLKHHFAEKEALYGVSSRLWDRILGTLTPQRRMDAFGVGNPPWGR